MLPPTLPSPSQYKLRLGDTCCSRDFVYIFMGKAYQLKRRYGVSPYMRALGATGSLIYNAGKKIAPYAAAAVFGSGSSGSGMNKKKGVRESGINTFQHDALNRYRYKRMPKRRRKRWTRFSKSVRHVNLQMQPLQIYTQKSVANGSSAVNAQSYYGYMLGGTQVTGNREIFEIFKDAYNTAAFSNCASYKIFIKSMCLDMQVTNTGSYPIIVDVYRLRCRKDYGSASTLAAEYTAAASELVATTGGRTYDPTDPSGTPFDVPNFLSYWKVISKREVIIGSNNTTTMQIRRPANQYVDGKSVVTNAQCLPGSEALFIMWRGCPSNRGGAGAAQLDAATITVATQTVIHYAIPPGKTQESGGSA